MRPALGSRSGRGAKGAGSEAGSNGRLSCLRPRRDGATAASKVFAVLGALFALLYPAAVYFGLTRLQPRLLGVVLAGLVLIGMGFRLTAQRRDHALAAARVPVIVAALRLAGAVVDDRRLLLALPALTNLALLAHFTAS